MLTNLLTVGQQVLVLFILIFVGFFLGKKGILRESGARALSDIALFVATPCVIVKAFQRPFSMEMLLQLGLALVVCAVIHGIGIALGALVYRQKTPRNRVLRLAVVLSNAGFMALPLQQAILGETGVFYGTAYVVMFNLILWSYGVALMDKDGGRLSAKKMLLNPGFLGLLAGLAVFLLPVELPQVLSAPIAHFAALNTPLPMLFIGYCLSNVDFRAALKQRYYYGAMALRLIAVPVISTAVLYLAGLRGDLLVSMTIAGCAPVAAGVPMFASRFGGDQESAANLVALSTLASLITMPLVVSLCQLLP